MSIADRKHCLKAYWRYRRDYPKAGYCSVPCSEEGPAKKPKALPPAKPDLVLFELRSHRITVHRDRSFLQWYECEECDRIQGLYAESLGYWMDHPVNSGGAERLAGIAG